MTEIRNRIYKARRRAREILTAAGYDVNFLFDGPFDIEASRKYELRKIKICLDTPKKTDLEIIQKITLPSSCQKEIWIKKPNQSKFEIIDFSTDVKRKFVTI